MISPRYRVALVGCGRIAHVHCGYLRQNPFAVCVGASDLSPDAREAFRRESRVAPACLGRVAGFGAGSYALALQGLLARLAAS